MEYYRYDLQGTPSFYNSSGQLLTGGTNYGVRHLFNGEQWYREIAAYDLRNRYYSPDFARFLQADPTGFSGDATNLYRYCLNNPLTRSDPTGLDIHMGGVQFTAAWPVIASFSLQGGIATNGWNPMNWSVGGAASVTPLTGFHGLGLGVAAVRGITDGPIPSAR